MAANTTSQSTTPQDRVFQSPELLEMVLLQLEALDCISTTRVCKTFKNAFEGSLKIQRKLFFKSDIGSRTAIPNPLFFEWKPMKEIDDDPGQRFDACITYRSTPFLRKLLSRPQASEASFRKMLILNRREDLSRLFIERLDTHDPNDPPYSHHTAHWLDVRDRHTIEEMLECWEESNDFLIRDGVDPYDFPDLGRRSRLWLPTRPDDFDDEGDCTITWAAWLREQEEKEQREAEAEAADAVEGSDPAESERESAAEQQTAEDEAVEGDSSGGDGQAATDGGENDHSDE